MLVLYANSIFIVYNELMKSVFLLLLSFPLFSLAQDCALKKEKDQFTQLPKISTGFIPIGSDKVSLEANTNKEIDMFFTVGNGKCFDDATMVTFIFEGGHYKTNYRNTGTMNCDGYFHVTFRNGQTTASGLQNLVTKKIQSFHFVNKKEVTDIVLTLEQQQMLQTMAGCIATEAKTLLPK